MRRVTGSACILAYGLFGASGCELQPPSDLPFEAGMESTETCLFVDEGFGPLGEAEVSVETVVDQLDTPWAIAFLGGGDLLVTERDGRLRLVEEGQLIEEPVAEIATANTTEGGLLGLALHPDFENNRAFYLYVTRPAAGGAVNRVERWSLSEDRRSATLDRVILDDIPGGDLHDGGRLRFGPDGLLYVSTGETFNAELAQDTGSLGGKILRVTDEGEVPDENPFENPVYILGVRNAQAFDFTGDGRLAIADHGPSGELLRAGGDEISVADVGDNLGWPTIWQCEEEPGLVSPLIAWDEALPPGGAAFYTGDDIPAWRGAFMVSALRAQELHLVRFNDNFTEVEEHAVYLPNRFGRLREVIMGPDGDLYLTTSNCDGRGACPFEGDKILRVGAP